MKDKTDRELLELAAKACGYLSQWDSDIQWVIEKDHEIESWWPWAPLIDDSDALRLAVTLRIYFMVVEEEGVISARIRGGLRASFRESIGGDEMHATRRAIVRAAAAIGESMK